MHDEAITVQFPGVDGVLPGFGVQRPNDWGLGFEIRDDKSPHWTGSSNSKRTFGHFGQSGTFCGWIRTPAWRSSDSPTAISATGRTSAGRRSLMES